MNTQRVSRINSAYNRHESRQRAFPKALQYTAVPLGVTAFMALTSVNANSLVQVVLAFLLLLIPWVAYQTWRDRGSSGPPIYAMIGALHWLYFAVALFWGDRVAPVWYMQNNVVSDDSVTATLFMIVLGMVALGIGFYSGLSRLITFKQRPSMTLTPSMWGYIRLLLIVGTFAGLFPSIIYILGEAGRQWIISFQTTIPLLAFIFLLRRYFQGEAEQIDKVLVVFYIIAQLVTGLSSGWSATVFYLGFTIGIVYLFERRRIPVIPLVVILLVFVFLQPGKSSFRQAFWYNQTTQADLFERVGYWVDESFQSWEGALRDPTGEQLVSYLRGSLLRVSLLTQSADVYTKTPDIVPFQEGRLYTFSFAGLIPRFIWPDKPSASEANQFYQVAYGVTREESLQTVSFAIGYLTEAYIAFGWLGVVFIMFLLGNFYRLIIDTFFKSNDSIIAQAVGLVAITQLFRVETQLGFYLIATIQAIVISYIFLIPITSIKFSR